MRISLESIDLAAGKLTFKGSPPAVQRRRINHSNQYIELLFFLLQIDHLKKRETPPTIKKSHSTTNATGEKYRHLEEDVATLGQMTDLAKTITVPHQVRQLNEI